MFEIEQMEFYILNIKHNGYSVLYQVRDQNILLLIYHTYFYCGDFDNVNGYRTFLHPIWKFPSGVFQLQQKWIFYERLDLR